MTKTKLNNNEKASFIYGYLYRTAEEFKESGNFQDMTVKEVTDMLKIEILNMLKEEKNDGRNDEKYS